MLSSKYQDQFSKIFYEVVYFYMVALKEIMDNALLRTLEFVFKALQLFYTSAASLTTEPSVKQGAFMSTDNARKPYVITHLCSCSWNIRAFGWHMNNVAILMLSPTWSIGDIDSKYSGRTGQYIGGDGWNPSFGLKILLKAFPTFIIARNGIRGHLVFSCLWLCGKKKL